jgi:hypothetical protein
MEGWTVQDILMRVGVGLAIAALVCQLIPEHLAIALAVSRHLHVAISVRLLLSALLLVLAGATSATALSLAIFRLTAPLRM